MKGRRRSILVLFAISLLVGCQASSSLIPSGQMPSGTWAGLLPCADCPGIRVQLQLWKQPDVYRLLQTYQSQTTSPRTFAKEGHWQRVPHHGENSLGMIVLQPAKEDGRQPPNQFFQQMPDGSLLKLDSRGKRTPSSLNYRLRRIRAPDS